MIFFFGDIHGDFRAAIAAVKAHRPDACVFLGDLECPQPFEEMIKPIQQICEVWFIHGNHDTDQETCWNNLMGGEMAGYNLHGRVVDIGGVKVAGLGGVFRGEIWMPPEEPQYLSYAEWENHLVNSCRDRGQAKSAAGLVRDIQASKRRKHRSTIFYDVYSTLYGQGADILVTHEAPSCHPHGFHEIDDLARSLRVKTLFHGHHHDRLDYSSHEQRTGFKSFGVGLRGITDEEGQVIAEGREDQNRLHRQKAVEGFAQNKQDS